MADPTIEMIRARAFAIWEEEGRPQGRDIEHWLRAEAELTAPAPKKAAPRKPAARKGAAKAPAKGASSRSKKGTA